MTTDRLTKQATELLSNLISIPRTSRNEAEAASFLMDHMEQECSIPTQRDGCNLWSVAPHYDSQLPTLLLNAHIDTVKPVDAWTHDPFTPRQEGGRLYGLGSNDDGASLVSLLQVFRVLREQQRPYNLVYLVSAEEEVSGRNGIEHVLPLLPHIDVALVGEPTGMQPAIAEKGLMVLDLTAHGKAGHAARNEGDNAIYRAIKDIQWFQTYRWERESPLLGPVKMTVTIINAGTQHNVVPDKCTFTVDVRSNELYTNHELYQQICQHVGSDVQARSFRLNSSRIELSHPLVQKIISLGGKPFGSPTLSDQALMPFPSLKMGPGQSSRSHTADEYIEIREIAEAIDFYLKVLQ
ncbi:MAG: M20 family metallo-hydrolase [Bacteroidaceae bacterium]|nr:M20 family metallo-hydrolase [Bacteroidaceae bacterium]